MPYKCRNNLTDPRKLHVLTHGITAILLMHYCDITDGGYLVYEVFSSVLQCGSVCCSVLQCVAPFKSACWLTTLLPAGTLICCNMLQFVAECCIVLQCNALCFTSPRHLSHNIATVCSSELHRPKLQYVQVRCINHCYSMFKWVASTMLGLNHSVRQGPLACTVCCRVLQRVAVCCGVLHLHTYVHHTVRQGPLKCSVLQCAAVCCSVLQRVAVCGLYMS